MKIVLDAMGGDHAPPVAIEGGVWAAREYGVEVVRCALEEPTRRIVENAGHDGGEIVAEVADRKGRVGFDVLTGKYTDLVKAGIVDPAKVAITALNNAASIAGLNLSTNTLVTELKEKKDPVTGAVT